MQKIHSSTWMVMVSNRTFTKPLNERGPFPISSVPGHQIRIFTISNMMDWSMAYMTKIDLIMMDFGNVIMINMGRKCALNN